MFGVDSLKICQVEHPAFVPSIDTSSKMMILDNVWYARELSKQVGCFIKNHEAVIMTSYTLGMSVILSYALYKNLWRFPFYWRDGVGLWSDEYNWDDSKFTKRFNEDYNLLQGRKLTFKYDEDHALLRVIANGSDDAGGDQENGTFGNWEKMMFNLREHYFRIIDACTDSDSFRSLWKNDKVIKDIDYFAPHFDHLHLLGVMLTNLNQAVSLTNPERMDRIGKCINESNMGFVFKEGEVVVSQDYLSYIFNAPSASQRHQITQIIEEDVRLSAEVGVRDMILWGWGSGWSMSMWGVWQMVYNVATWAYLPTFFMFTGFWETFNSVLFNRWHGYSIQSSIWSHGCWYNSSQHLVSAHLKLEEGVLSRYIMGKSKGDRKLVKFKGGFKLYVNPYINEAN